MTSPSQIEPGTMFGLLGPNGSGKTSSIRMMIGITVPDSGAVRLFDQPFDRASLLRRVGYLPEERGLYKKMNVLDQLIFLGQLHGLDAPTAAKRARLWCERMEISDAILKKTEELSKGMQQKIQFIAALLHEPDLIIMDEPFSGLDPVNADLLMETLARPPPPGQDHPLLHPPHGPGREALRRHRADPPRPSRPLRLHARDQIPLPAQPRRHRTSRATTASSTTPPSRATRATPAHAEIKLHANGAGSDAQSLLADAVARGARISRFEVMEPTLEEIFIEAAEAKPMHNVWLIAQREYLERIRTKSFLVITILIPLLIMGGCSLRRHLFGSEHSAAHIAVVSPTPSCARPPTGAGAPRATAR